MKRRMGYKKVFVMSAAALGMTALLSLPGASAYFTTYVSAGGSQVVHMGAQTEIREEVSAMTKHISIRNTSPTGTCFVRVKVFHGGQFTTDYNSEGDLWTRGNEDYWYYGPALAPGESTELLDVKIHVPENFDRDQFQVIVVQECAPAAYDEEGNLTADWDMVYRDYQEEEVRD